MSRRAAALSRLAPLLHDHGHCRLWSRPQSDRPLPSGRKQGSWRASLAWGSSVWWPAALERAAAGCWTGQA